MFVIGSPSHIHNLCQIHYEVVAKHNEALPAYDDLGCREDLETRVHQLFLEKQKTITDASDAIRESMREAKEDAFLIENQPGYKEAYVKFKEHNARNIWDSSRPARNYYALFILSMCAGIIACGIIFGFLYQLPIVGACSCVLFISVFVGILKGVIVVDSHHINRERPSFLNM